MKFFIKSKKKKGNCYLFFEINKRKPKFKAQFNTFVTVDIQQWNKAQESADNLKKYMNTAEGAKVIANLQAIENAVNDLFVSGKIHYTTIENKKIIQDAVDVISFAEERARMAEEQTRKEEKERKEREKELNKYKDIITFYTWYIDGIKNGTINGKKIKPNTARSWETFGGHLKNYMKTRKEKTFDEITPIFRDSFAIYLKSLNVMQNTISLYVSKFRALCKASAKYGYNNNSVSLFGWENVTVKQTDKKAEVYMTEEEIEKLYDMRLFGGRALVRDMFVFGVCVAQRFSDFSDISPKMFSKIDNVIFFTFQQKKTGKKMIVPITDRKALNILKKYNYSFPNISDHHFNHTLKNIVKDLAETVPTLKEEFETAPTKYDLRTLKPKYELVSSHTARRSAVTNMNKIGILSKREMMALTGHSTEKIFEDYIKTGAVEQAKQIAEKLSKANKK